MNSLPSNTAAAPYKDLQLKQINVVRMVTRLLCLCTLDRSAAFDTIVIPNHIGFAKPSLVAHVGMHKIQNTPADI